MRVQKLRFAGDFISSSPLQEVMKRRFHPVRETIPTEFDGLASPTLIVETRVDGQPTLKVERVNGPTGALSKWSVSVTDPRRLSDGPLGAQQLVANSTLDRAIQPSSRAAQDSNLVAWRKQNWDVDFL